jgi:hypothetical protein
VKMRFRDTILESPRLISQSPRSMHPLEMAAHGYTHSIRAQTTFESGWRPSRNDYGAEHYWGISLRDTNIAAISWGDNSKVEIRIFYQSNNQRIFVRGYNNGWKDMDPLKTGETSQYET